MKNKKVLIVDDHAMIRESLRRIIESEPDMVVVGEAGNGREAIDAVSDLRPDIVTMDVGMPGLNGIDALRQIHRICTASRVLLITAHEEEVCIDRAIECGIDGFVGKRSAVELLARAIREVAAGKKFFPPSVARRAADFEAARHSQGHAARMEKRSSASLTQRERRPPTCWASASRRSKNTVKTSWKNSASTTQPASPATPSLPA
jgi:DNA-binding NarL/FixJ family response regulator